MHETHEKSIRADMWDEMTIEQLLEQSSLLLDRIITIQSLQGSLGTQSATQMIASLEQGRSIIEHIIERRNYEHQ